jgi:cell division protein FtsX
MLVAVVGALATAALLLAGASAALATAERLPVGKLPSSKADVDVFMTVGATKAQVAAVEHRIRTSKQVRRYAHFDQRAAKAEFDRIFKRNPDLVASVTAADLPESFPVDLERARDAAAFARGMRSLPGVDTAEPKEKAPTEADLLSVIRRCQARDFDVEIFMRNGATQSEIDGVVGAVAAEPGLIVTRVLSQAEAYEEFRRVFASNPEMVDAVTAADLPVSVRVHAVNGVSGDALTRLRSGPGVDSVAAPDHECDAIQGLLDRGLTPEALARLLVRYSAGLPV